MSKLTPDWQKSNVLESVFDQLSDALVLYDTKFRITGVNRSAEELFGIPAAEMFSRDCQELFQCAKWPPECGVMADQAHSTFHLNRRNGLKRMVSVRTHKIVDDDGHLAGSVATIKDVTQKTAPHTHAMIAESPVMLEILRFVRRIAESEAATVLLDGETGTGKDLIAKTLHYQSRRHAEPFIAVNCAAIPETLLESELFGYEKGAFTDARAQKPGIFELADKGTLFLDEVGEIPSILQAKLLRVLEEQKFRRLGGLTDIQLDLRVVAATNKSLREAVNEGAFRQDLYYRLNVIQITVPPLRERTADIQPLAEFFIEHYNRRFHRCILGLSAPATKLLLSYDWPGNVRELRNAIERGMILEESAWITASSLPIAVSGSGGHAPPVIAASTETFNEWTALEDSERSLLARALKQTGGNQTKAARLLRVTRDTLRYRKRKLSLP